MIDIAKRCKQVQIASENKWQSMERVPLQAFLFVLFVLFVFTTAFSSKQVNGPTASVSLWCLLFQ
jgi:hypothetical protein